MTIVPDPAAAPLGTDDEAAGTRPTREQVRRAEAEDLTRHRRPGPEPGLPPQVGGRGPVRAVLWVLLALVVALLVVRAL